VAIIDDGIDMFHGEFQGSIANGVSFHSSGGLDTIMPYFFSSSGHGTMIAKVIYQVCPTAEFYITRVEEASFSGGINQLTAKSAAKVRIPSLTYLFLHLTSMET